MWWALRRCRVHCPVAIPGLQSFLHSWRHVVHEHGLGPPPQDNTELKMFTKTRMPSISDNAIFFCRVRRFSLPQKWWPFYKGPTIEFSTKYCTVSLILWRQMKAVEWIFWNKFAQLLVNFTNITRNHHLGESSGLNKLVFSRLVIGRHLYCLSINLTFMTSENISWFKMKLLIKAKFLPF